MLARSKRQALTALLPLDAKRAEPRASEASRRVEQAAVAPMAREAPAQPPRAVRVVGPMVAWALRKARQAVRLVRPAELAESSALRLERDASVRPRQARSRSATSAELDAAERWAASAGSTPRLVGRKPA